MDKYKLFVISGPSGVGKGTIVRKLLKGWSGATLSISATTRKKSNIEEDGIHYYFKTNEEFDKLIVDNAFLEWAEYNGNKYGTLKSVVDDGLKTNNVILEIDVQGAMQIRDKDKDAILIFISPPDSNTLLSRLRGRGRENEEEIEKRYDEAKRELATMVEYNYVVVNDDLDNAVSEIKDIIKGEK